jgi:glutamate synthase (NADPH/NADH)
MAVCEGVGDHGLEYMTGGRAVILGSVGKNFAAGMSGGIGYVYDPDDKLAGLCNTEMVDVGPVVRPGDVAELKALIQQHRRYTKSPIAAQILKAWGASLKSFRRVMPREFRKIHEAPVELGKKQPPVLKALVTKSAAKVGKGGGALSAPAGGGASKKKGGAAGEGAGTTSSATAAAEEPAAAGSGKDIEDFLAAKEKARPSSIQGAIKKKGFIAYARGAIGYRPAAERMADWKEIGKEVAPEVKGQLLKTQAARCMDCGVPFCHQTKTGCPLGNRIPEWNEYVYQGRWKEAYFALAATNNFPEFTGRVCPAPCEGSCVLGIIESPVSIKNIECSIIDRAFSEGWIVPNPPKSRSGKKVFVVGSGPSGLAAADMLNRAGHLVTVHERADRVGGLMMYGVPNMKCDKEEVINRRVRLLEAEGITFRTGVAVGRDVSVEELREGCDALLLATGSTMPRDLKIEGRESKGIHFAMEFLTKNTKALLDKDDSGKISVAGKHVVVIGGGDTGNDCIGTSVRQGAASVTNFELLPTPPNERAPENPWPQWSVTLVTTL